MNKIFFSTLTFIIFSFSGNSQISFEGVGSTTTPTQFAHFMQMQKGEMAYADVDGDGDMDVLITGVYVGGSTIGHANLYLNDGQGNFSPKTNHGITGLNYSKIDFGDIDGDNDPDLIITGSNPSGIKVVHLYTNDGSGVFTSITTTTINPGYRGEIKFVDIEGDGDLDIFVSGDTPTGENTSLHLNDGSGNFTLASGTPFVGLTNSAFDFADIDGDNDLDILITGVDGGAFKLTNLFLNDGSGNFTLDVSANFENVGWGTVVFEDIDGDTDEDVVLTGAVNTSGVNATLFYKNDGNGNFTVISTGPTTLVTGSHVGSVTFADFNSDGNNDLFITGVTLPSNTRFTERYDNDGNGNFTLNTATFPEVRFSSALCFDINNDTYSDLLYLGEAASTSITKYYINNGSGDLEEVISTPFSNVFDGDIDFADIDGDNDLDLLISGRKTSELTKLYENDGNGIYTIILSTPFTNVKYGSNAFADVDGDGDLDVLITGAGTSSGTVSNLYVNDGNGNYTLSSNSISNVRNSAVAFADIDGDNDLDLLITGTHQLGGSNFPISELYINDGNGIFTLMGGTSFAGVENSTVNFADVDGDNDLDVFITGQQGNSTLTSILYTNDGNGNFSINWGSTFINIHKGGVDFADIDGDNDLDIVITGSTTKLYENDGSGNFSEITSTTFPNLSESSAKFGDFDGDNSPDLLIFGKYGTDGPKTELYKNDGNGNYTLEVNQPFVNIEQGAITIGDIDGDGDIDLAMMGLPEDTHVSSLLYRNTSCTNTTINTTTTTSNQTITANENNIAATYQWLDCNNNSTIISGETNQNYIATANGNYACQITVNCSVDTTNCTEITSLGLNKNVRNEQIVLYPNPATSQITLKTTNLVLETMTILDISGKKINNIQFNGNMVDISSIAKGVYFILIQTHSGLYTQKFIKE